MKMYKNTSTGALVTYEYIKIGWTANAGIAEAIEKEGQCGLGSAVMADIEADYYGGIIASADSIEDALKRLQSGKIGEGAVKNAFIEYLKLFELVGKASPKYAYSLLEVQSMLQNGQIDQGTELVDSNGHLWVAASGCLATSDPGAAGYGLKEYNTLKFKFKEDEPAPETEAGIPCEMKTEPEPKPRERYRFRDNSVTVFNGDEDMYALALNNKLIVSIKSTVHIVDMDKGFVDESILDAFGVQTFQNVTNNKKRFKYSKNLIKNIIKTH